MIQPSPVSDRYQVGEVFGDGGQSRVFMAIDRQTGENVVIKHIPTVGDPLSHGIGEFAALLSLKHPNIVRCLDFGYNRDRSVVIVYEYVSGGTLRSYLKEGEATHASFWKKCAIDILNALIHLHQRNWVHCDLKPENILIEPGIGDTSPNFKLADFGMASLTEFPGAIVHGGGGSPGYTAPEGFGGAISASSDLYALGVILYEMASGQRPFDGDIRGLARAHAYDKPDFNCIQLPGVDAFIGALLAKQPEHRPASAEEALSIISPKNECHSSSISLSSTSAPESPPNGNASARSAYTISPSTELPLTGKAIAPFSIRSASRYEILEYQDIPYIAVVCPSHLEIRNGLTGAPTNQFIQKSGGNYQIHGRGTILTVDEYHVRKWIEPWHRAEIIAEMDDFAGKTVVAEDGVRAAWSKGERVCLINLKQRSPSIVHETSYSGLSPQFLFPRGNSGYVFIPGTLHPEVQLFDNSGTLQRTHKLSGPVFDVPSHSLPALLSLPSSSNTEAALILTFFHDDFTVTSHEVSISARMYSFVENGFIYTDKNSKTWMINYNNDCKQLQLPTLNIRSILFSPSMKYFYSMENVGGLTLFKPHRCTYNE